MSIEPDHCEPPGRAPRARRSHRRGRNSSHRERAGASAGCAAALRPERRVLPPRSPPPRGTAGRAAPPPPSSHHPVPRLEARGRGRRRTRGRSCDTGSRRRLQRRSASGNRDSARAACSRRLLPRIAASHDTEAHSFVQRDRAGGVLASTPRPAVDFAALRRSSGTHSRSSASPEPALTPPPACTASTPIQPLALSSPRMGRLMHRLRNLVAVPDHASRATCSCLPLTDDSEPRQNRKRLVDRIPSGSERLHVGGMNRLGVTRLERPDLESARPDGSLENPAERALHLEGRPRTSR